MALAGTSSRSGFGGGGSSGGGGLAGNSSRSGFGGSRSGGGHCATCTCNQRGDLMQKQMSPQGLVSTVKDFEKRVTKLESATKQGNRNAALSTKARRNVPRDKRSQFGTSTGGLVSASGSGNNAFGSGRSGGPSFV